MCLIFQFSLNITPQVAVVPLIELDFTLRNSITKNKYHSNLIYPTKQRPG